MQPRFRGSTEAVEAFSVLPAVSNLSDPYKPGILLTSSILQPRFRPPSAFPLQPRILTMSQNSLAMSSALSSSQPNKITKSLLLNLPAEVRLMIWKAAWTVDGIGKRFTKGQIRAIGLLGKTCRQMRAEAYADLFNRTQLVCRRRNYSLSDYLDWMDDAVMEILLRSNLIHQNNRHVSLHWRRHGDYYDLKTMRWLATAPQLSTLEIVFTDSGLLPSAGVAEDGKPNKLSKPKMEEYFHQSRYDLALEGPRVFDTTTVEWGPRRTRLSLDKITFRLDFERAEDIEIWEKTEWFRDIKHKMAKAHLKKEGEVSAYSLYQIFFFSFLFSSGLTTNTNTQFTGIKSRAMPCY